MNKYVIDHGGDMALKFSGSDMSALLSDAVKAFSEAVGAPDDNPGAFRSIRVEATDYEELAVTFLNELIFLLESQMFLASEASVEYRENEKQWHEAEATLTGWVLNQGQEVRALPKSATYHNLQVQRRGEIWTAKVVMDL